MTIDQIRQEFRTGKLTAQQALKNLAPYMRQKDKTEAQALVSEILGMPEEPKSVTEKEREIAKGWRKIGDGT